jgi:hypothetical protein
MAGLVQVASLNVLKAVIIEIKMGQKIFLELKFKSAVQI